MQQPLTYPYPYPCPKCGAPMLVKSNTKTGTHFFGCSEFPHCYTSRDLTWEPAEEAPADWTPERVAEALEGVKTEEEALKALGLPHGDIEEAPWDGR